MSKNVNIFCVNLNFQKILCRYTKICTVGLVCKITLTLIYTFAVITVCNLMLTVIYTTVLVVDVCNKMLINTHIFY